MTKIPYYSRVLIKAPGFYRTFRNSSGQVAFRYDSGSLIYLVEELVALSACEIALSPRSARLASETELPPVLRDRVKVLDSSGDIDREVAALLAPILEEYGFVDHGEGTLARPDSLRQLTLEELDAFSVFFPALYILLLGARSQTQVDIDLNRFRTAVQILRGTCRSSTARAHLAVIGGVLNVYQPTSIPSLLIPRAGTDEQERRFKYLVEDLEYRNLSEGAAMLGIPADALRAARLMKRGLDAILRSAVATWGAIAATKVIATAASAPSVDLDPAALQGPLNYLPPVVSLSTAYDRALEQWKKTRVPAKDTDRFGRLFREGFVEVSDAPQPRLEDFQGQPAEYLVHPEDDL